MTKKMDDVIEENNLEAGAVDEAKIDVDESLIYFDDELNDEDLIFDLPEFSSVVVYYGNSLTDKDWLRQRIDFNFEIAYSDQSICLKEPIKFMSSKVIEASESLNNFLNNFLSEIRNSFQEINDRYNEKDESELHNLIKDLSDENSFNIRLNSKTVYETYYAGRIQYGSIKCRQAFPKIFLESFEYKRDLVQLDLSFLKTSNLQYSIFPGKIVILKGQNFNGNCISVTKFIEYGEIVEPSFPSKCPSVLSGKERFNIVCACGPFIRSSDNPDCFDPTDTTCIRAIADYLRKYNPDVLFLIGPFYDDSMAKLMEKWSVKNIFLSSGSYPYQWSFEKLMNQQIKTLFDEIDGLSVHTKIILIPSSNELGMPSIYPMYPVEIKSLNKILSFSNPSLLNLGGISVGLSSTDILMHLGRREIQNFTNSNQTAKNVERLKTLCGHVVSHCHFYPLNPPDPSVNLEHSFYHTLTMPVTPHLLILPSLLRPFVYNVKDTIVINPGKISKNTLARIMVEPLENPCDYSGSIAQYTNVEIFKLIKDK